jgi:DNA-binding Lrp family transcriptional regulator
MIEIASETLKYTGPLILAIFKRGLEGKSQKETAKAVNRDETWVSRRVQKSVEYGLMKVEEEERWGWHRTYGTNARWKVNVIKLTEKGREVAKTLLYLDPVIEKCQRCGMAIDVTGYSGLIACPFCSHKFYVEGIEPQEYALPGLRSAARVFIDTLVSEIENNRPGRTGIFGFPLGPLRRLGWYWLNHKRTGGI